MRLRKGSHQFIQGDLSLHCSRKPDESFDPTGLRNENQIRPPATIRVHDRTRQQRYRHQYSLNQTEGHPSNRLPPHLQSYTNLSQLLDDLQFLLPQNQSDATDTLPSIDGGSAAIAMNHISRLRKGGKAVVTPGQHARSDTAMQALASAVASDAAVSPKHLALAVNAASASGAKLLWLLEALCPRLAATLERDPAAFTAQVPPPYRHRHHTPLLLARRFGPVSAPPRASVSLSARAVCAEARARRRASP